MQVIHIQLCLWMSDVLFTFFKHVFYCFFVLSVQYRILNTIS